MFKDYILELKQQGLTYQEIGDIMDVSYQTVQCYVTKGIYPKVKNLILLAENRNTSIDYMLGLIEKPRPLHDKKNKEKRA